MQIKANIILFSIILTALFLASNCVSDPNFRVEDSYGWNDLDDDEEDYRLTEKESVEKEDASQESVSQVEEQDSSPRNDQTMDDSLPQVNTRIIPSTIAGVSAQIGLEITNQGDSPIEQAGICWNSTGTPTLDDEIALSEETAGTFSPVILTELSQGTLYYARAFVSNGNATFYGNEIRFDTGFPFGTLHEGGYLFYNDGEGGGLVVAQENLRNPRPFSDTMQLAGTGDSIGSGLGNTQLIAEQDKDGTSAALACLNYTDGVREDWYLPSIEELALIRINLGSMERFNLTYDFVRGYYWSSSESAPHRASLCDFNLDAESYRLTAGKGTDYRIRPIRSF